MAGDGSPRFAGDGGAAVNASLEVPTGVAVDGAGNIYIADQQNYRIRRVDAAGNINTVAGNGNATFAGDGGAATAGSLNGPFSVAVDSGGSLYIADFGNQRIRRVRNNVLSTVAGSGAFKYSGDGAAATSASLDQPRGVAVDAAGNIYIADSENHRIRKVSADTGIIATVAGAGVQGLSGDGGPATSAALNAPRGVALDAAGNIYIADTFNARIRKVSLSGAITTVAGTQGGSAAGDGGPATSATMGATWAVAVDGAGNIYIADRQNSRIRKVAAATGIITTLAGGGSSFAEGVPAASSALNSPGAVAVDAAGNVYISDTLNNRVRRVNTSGVITTIAGTGTFGFAGDGGAATSAQLTEPQGLAVDAAGNLYIADNYNARVRRVTAGTIRTVAGGGTGEQFAGDGGPATSARMSAVVTAVAVDAAGGLYIADTDNDRIRKVLAAAPAFTVSPTSLAFTAAAGAPSVSNQQLLVTGLVTGLGWTAQATTESGGAWLAVSPVAGAVPGALTANVRAPGLAPGAYRGRITVQAPLAFPPTQTVTVDLTITTAEAPRLSVDPAAITFEGEFGRGNPAARTLRIANAGGGTLSWTAQAETVSGGGWLAVSPASGAAASGSPSIIEVRASSAGLSPGVYPGSIKVESAGASGAPQTVAVTLVITQVTQSILVSQSGLQFIGVAGAGAAPPQSFGILNMGQGVMSWTARAGTLAGGSWLSVSPASGQSDAASTQIPLVEARVNTAGMSAGRYSGLIQVDATGANNSPQFVIVELSVLPQGSNPGVQVRPTGLIFAAEAGTQSPSSQSVRLATATPGSVEARAGLATFDGASWLEALPRSVAISAGEVGSITVQPRLGNLAPGLYRGAVTLLFGNGSPSQVVEVLLVLTARTGSTSAVIAEAGSSTAGFPAPAAETQCTPRRLYAVLRSLGANFSSPAGWPAPIEVQVSDDCGSAVANATVVTSFSNGDPPLALAGLRNGIYAATWRPVTGSTAPVVVAIRANLPPLEAAEVQAQGQVAVNPAAPLLYSGGIVNGASFVRGGALAPGAIVSLFGSNMAAGQNYAAGLPLETKLGGASLTIAGKEVPLFFSNAGQINAQLPFDLAANSRPQVVLRSQAAGGGSEALAVPETITVAAVQPAIFTINQQGAGQGAILNAETPPRLVDSSAPARVGDVVQVFCTGLGATSPTVASGSAAPGAEPLARVVMPVEARVGGKPATVHFAGLAPGFAGLYQVNVEIPSGIEAGGAVSLVLIQNAIPSNTVTLAVR